MRYTGANYEYHVTKLECVDPDNNVNKFYTVVEDRHKLFWAAHYGRIGTAGSCTAKKQVRSLMALRQAADKQINSKVNDKNYVVLESGRVLTAHELNIEQVARHGRVV